MMIWVVVIIVWIMQLMLEIRKIYSGVIIIIMMLLIQNPTSQPRCFNHYHHYYLTATAAHYHHHNHELFTGIFIIIINNIVSAVNITFMANTITNICELCIKIWHSLNSHLYEMFVISDSFLHCKHIVLEKKLGSEYLYSENVPPGYFSAALSDAVLRHWSR